MHSYLSYAVSLSFQQQLFQIQVYTTRDKAVRMVLELICIQSYGQYVEKHLVHTHAGYLTIIKL